MKLLNFIKEKFERDETDEDKLVIEIITKMCAHPDTRIQFAPKTDRYLLDNEKLQYFVVICDSYYKITNHVFYIKNYGHISKMVKLIDVIEDRMELDRDAFELEEYKNEMELLKTISNNLTIKK
jgi:hypothetical protein